MTIDALPEAIKPDIEPVRKPIHKPLSRRSVIRRDRDIIAQEREGREAAEANSLTDPLTGLKSTRWFESELNTRIANAQRHPEQDFYFELIDFDDFKKFNNVDYAVGNSVLKTMGQVENRPGEDLARWGGDEFAQIFNSGISHEDAIKVAARNANRITELSTAALAADQDAVNAGVKSATVSIALLKYLPGMTPESILKTASTLIKQAKDAEKKDRIFVSIDGGITSSEVNREDFKDK